jgi:hypothetical protein
LDLGVFPCIISLGSDNSGASTPESRAFTVLEHSVPAEKHTLNNPSTNKLNVLLSNLKKNVTDMCPINDNKKIKSREHLKRFIYPRTDPEPSNIMDSWSDQQILMSILRTLSCVLNKDQVNLWSEICQRDLQTSEQYKSSLPKLRCCTLDEINQYKLNKAEQQQVTERIGKLASPSVDISESVHDLPITKQPVPGEYELHKQTLAKQNMEHVYSLSAKIEDKALKVLHQAWLQGYLSPLYFVTNVTLSKVN